MDTLLIALALVAFLFWVPNTLEMLVGFALTPRLRNIPPLPDADCPSLSIIVPACNEGATVEPAMRSLLALDYPNLEIVAVNDRSTDDTGAILNRLAATDPRLRVLHVTELPEGWLGKNHALQRGGKEASGEFLLFTDADVVYRPDALRRALALVQRSACDHLVAFPLIQTEGFWECSFISFFITMFSIRFHTWQAPWRWGWGYVGVGAFNMVRASAYGQLGGHEPLRMEVGDDIRLGRLFKRRGYRTTIAGAVGHIEVRWAVGLQGVVQVLTKNAFCGFDYSWPSLAISGAGILISSVWPVIGLLAGPSPARYLYAAVLLSMLAAAASFRDVGSRVPVLYALTWPLAALLFLFICIRSAFLTQRQGGIYWRGTFYPLDALKQQRGG